MPAPFQSNFQRFICFCSFGEERINLSQDMSIVIMHSIFFFKKDDRYSGNDQTSLITSMRVLCLSVYGCFYCSAVEQMLNENVQQLSMLIQPNDGTEFLYKRCSTCSLLKEDSQKVFTIVTRNLNYLNPYDKSNSSWMSLIVVQGKR